MRWRTRPPGMPGIHGIFTNRRHIVPSFRYNVSHFNLSSQQEAAMEDRKNQFRIELTPEQKDQVRHATGKDAEAVELSVEELEERIAPVKMKLR
jgi:hypothetical protein